MIGNYTLDLPDDFTVCRGDSVVINPTLAPGDVDGDFSWSWTGGSSQSRLAGQPSGEQLAVLASLSR